MKSVASAEDAERLGAFNEAIHGDGTDAMTRELILHHPHTRPEHWLYVEDDASGQVVSSLCLIPWTWRYGSVTLRAGEMGIVGTLEPYRHRGLIRALDGRFKELLRDGGYHLSHIQGIPYYYRQFGYEYTLPLEVEWNLDLYRIPDAEHDTGWRFRQATLDDVPLLARLYDDAMADLDISAVRDADTWRFLLEHSPKTAMASETWLLLEPGGQPVAYFIIELGGFGVGLNVNGASRVRFDQGQAILRQLKALAVERGKPFVRLNLHDQSTLVQLAREWGAYSDGGYAWQIYLPDVAALLRQIGPVLEQRLAHSIFAGLTDSVTINLYRAAFRMQFEGGQLKAVEALGRVETGGLHLPPTLFAPLVLGYRSREELHANYPDVSMWGYSGLLIDTLFPRMESFIHMIY
ncbi:MAG: GNAT family N-acetyltransferase [Chloroflexi bacterium]|nr:GNAT family N-acetyltransferase [Chloroflexota bacterium]